jgi:hypothetical protein
MPPVGFDPTITAGASTQIYTLDRAATGTGDLYRCKNKVGNFECRLKVTAMTEFTDVITVSAKNLTNSYKY